MFPNKPRVTVVIPAYNAEAFVERTVKSALNQTYENIEIVVVNDGSKDRTAEVVEGLCGEFPNVTLKTIANGGVANARNVGTELAGDGYIAYLDADDLWHPRKIEEQLAALARHEGDPSWAACYTGFRKIDLEDLPIRDGVQFKASGDFFAEHLIYNHTGNGSSLLVRRDVALEVGGFDSTLAARGIGGCEDRDFQLKILQKYKMEVVPEFLVGYRMHPSGMSTNRSAMALGQIEVIETHLSDPRVDATLKKKAISAAHRSAIVKLWVSGQKAKAMQSLFLHVVHDPLHGPLRSIKRVAFLTKSHVSGLFWRMAQLRKKRSRPHTFYDLNPKKSLHKHSLQLSISGCVMPSKPLANDIAK